MQSKRGRSMHALLIVAHCDDETLWGGANLMVDPERWHVIVACHKRTKRERELRKALAVLGVRSCECFTVPDEWTEDQAYSDTLFLKSRSFLARLKELSKREWRIVLTHSPSGEYGHVHHVTCSRLVTDYFGGGVVKYFAVSNTRLPDSVIEKKRLALQTAYAKQAIAGDLARGTWKHTDDAVFKFFHYETVYDKGLKKVEDRICCFDIHNNERSVIDVLRQTCKHIPLSLAHCDDANIPPPGTKFEIQELYPSVRSKLIISFAVFGANPVYTRGIKANIVLARTVYPGWTCRFYVDDSVPAPILKEAVALGAQVYVVRDKWLTGMRRTLWRFLPLGEDCRFICRDVDARVNAKEAWAINRWIESGKTFHLMWDDPEHGNPMLAGMWGAVGPVIKDVEERILQWRMTGYRSDEFFLFRYVFPKVKRSLMRHGCGTHPRPFFDKEPIDPIRFKEMQFPIELVSGYRIGERAAARKPDSFYLRTRKIKPL